MSQPPRAAHLAAASLNQTVGDWAGNRDRILRAVEEARGRGARLLVLPELCISGYSLGDRLLMRGTLDRSWASLREIQAATEGLVVCVGLPIRHRGVLYNAVAVLGNGRLWGMVAKQHLATGDVQYENRWYQGWRPGRVEELRCPDGETIPMGHLVFDGAGLGRFGVEVCEDGWKGLRPGSIHSLAGAQILVNPSASWFTVGKQRIRRRMVTQISQEDHCVYVYCSLAGCDATRLVFDGSVLIANDGELVAEGERFRFDRDVTVTDAVVDLEALAHARAEEGSWRQQVEALEEGRYGWLPTVVPIDADLSTERIPRPRQPYWLDGTRQEPVDASLAWMAPFTARDLPYLELELGLCMGLREYVGKCGIPRIALALSGGRDSAMVALLVARMLRYDNPGLDEPALRALVAERFVTAYLATANSSVATRDAARAVATDVGSRHLEVDLQEAFDLHVRLVSELTGRAVDWEGDDIALQNVQARLRSSLIWMVANLEDAVLLATSNKSEAAVGYTTMDGDTSGGLAPIADVPKSLIITWLEWARTFHDLPSLDAVAATPATAELRPPGEQQTDEGDLMPYGVLDQLMYHFVQLGLDPLEMFRSLWPAVEDRYGGDAKAFAEHIRRFVRMLCGAQWKRERFAISFRVMAFDLDPKTGFRFPPVQAPFTEELAELDAHVAALTA